jgi:hypothetical protein
MKAIPARKSPFILTPRDEQILRVLYDFRYMTARDMAYLRFSPTILNYVRSRLARLSGGADLQPNTYLCRFQLPTISGKGEKIFTLGVKGRDFLEREAGLPVDWYFRPYKLKHLGFTHLLHSLLQTRFVVVASYYSRHQQQVTLTHSRLSHELARTSGLNVIPDAWLLFENQQGKKYQILLEIDRGTEYQAKFKAHVKARLSLIESNAYKEVFGVKAVMVAYVTTGQSPEYRDARLEAMTRWTQEVLAELGMEDWAGIFRFTSVVLDEIYDQGIFEKAIWYQPDAPQAVPLFI